MKIYSDDGRVFPSVAECNAYESELKLKKLKEETERKTREEEQKNLAQYREVKLKEINDDLSVVVDKIRKYEKETGYKIIYGFDYPSQKTVVKDTLNNSIDFAWSTVYGDLISILRKQTR